MTVQFLSQQGLQCRTYVDQMTCFGFYAAQIHSLSIHISSSVLTSGTFAKRVSHSVNPIIGRAFPSHSRKFCREASSSEGSLSMNFLKPFGTSSC